MACASRRTRGAAALAPSIMVSFLGELVGVLDGWSARSPGQGCALGDDGLSSSCQANSKQSSTIAVSSAS